MKLQRMQTLKIIIAEGVKITDFARNKSGWIRIQLIKE